MINTYNYYLNASSWDEWVTAKRILKYNEENLKKQKDLIASQK